MGCNCGKKSKDFQKVINEAKKNVVPPAPVKTLDMDVLAKKAEHRRLFLERIARRNERMAARNRAKSGI